MQACMARAQQELPLTEIEPLRFKSTRRALLRLPGPRRSEQTPGRPGRLAGPDTQRSASTQRQDLTLLPAGGGTGRRTAAAPAPAAEAAAPGALAAALLAPALAARAALLAGRGARVRPQVASEVSQRLRRGSPGS